MNRSGPFHINQAIVCVWVYFRVLCFVSLVYLSHLCQYYIALIIKVLYWAFIYCNVSFQALFFSNIASSPRILCILIYILESRVWTLNELLCE